MKMQRKRTNKINFDVISVMLNILLKENRIPFWDKLFRNLKENQLETWDIFSYKMEQCDFSYLTLAMTNFQSLLVEKITNYGGLFEVKLLGQNALLEQLKVHHQL